MEGMTTSEQDPEYYWVRDAKHHSGMFGSFVGYLDTGVFTDMTISTRGLQLRVHRLILAAKSTYLEKLLRTFSPSAQHVLPLTGISAPVLRLILQYIYQGEVIVKASQSQDFFKAAKSLEIKGLSDHRGNRDRQNSEAVGPTQDANQDQVTLFASRSEESSGDSQPFISKNPLNLTKFLTTNADMSTAISTSSEGPSSEGPVADFQMHLDVDAEEVHPLPPAPSLKCALAAYKRLTEPPPRSRRYKHYSPEAMDRAMEAVKKGMSAHQAAKLFNIPSRTVYSRIEAHRLPNFDRPASTNGATIYIAHKAKTTMQPPEKVNEDVNNFHDVCVEALDFRAHKFGCSNPKPASVLQAVHGSYIRKRKGGLPTLRKFQLQ